jgi:hypothetical protein
MVDNGDNMDFSIIRENSYIPTIYHQAKYHFDLYIFK